MTHSINTETQAITITLGDGSTVTFPLEDATDVIRQTLAARKDGYEARREAKKVERATKKAATEKAKAERTAAATAKREASIAKLEKRLAAMKAKGQTVANTPKRGSRAKKAA